MKCLNSTTPDGNKAAKAEAPKKKATKSRTKE